MEDAAPFLSPTPRMSEQKQMQTRVDTCSQPCGLVCPRVHAPKPSAFSVNKDQVSMAVCVPCLR